MHDPNPQELSRMNQPRRIFAILPAAGKSRRMGQPKLLLPVGKTTVINRVVRTLMQANVDGVFVVVRPDDEPLHQAAQQAGATVIRPATPPADMRQSVQYALDYLAEHHHPQENDGWLLIPADHPSLELDVLETLLHNSPPSPQAITIPTYEGRRGHPTLFPWRLAAEVPQLPPDQGLNRLVRAHAENVREIPVSAQSILWDLDTPQDYQQLLARLNDQP
jgi:molybdenum cofactor cytidylyltransferase